MMQTELKITMSIDVHVLMVLRMSNSVMSRSCKVVYIENLLRDIVCDASQGDSQSGIVTRFSVRLADGNVSFRQTGSRLENLLTLNGRDPTNPV